MKNAFIHKVSSCGALADTDVSMLEAASRSARKFPARHDLIREGDEPGPIFVMLEGWACRYKLLPEGGRQIVAFLMPGDFSDLHLTVSDQMDHSIATLTPALVATVPRMKMAEIVETSPAITKAFFWSQLIDEGTLRAWIVSMGRRGSDERVAHLMCELYIRARNAGLAADHHFEMPLTQIALADAVGLTPVHVNRVLRKLRLAGIMHLASRMLAITDIGRLVAVAGFDENYLHRRLSREAKAAFPAAV